MTAHIRSWGAYASVHYHLSYVLAARAWRPKGRETVFAFEFKCPDDFSCG